MDQIILYEQLVVFALSYHLFIRVIISEFIQDF